MVKPHLSVWLNLEVLSLRKQLKANKVIRVGPDPTGSASLQEEAAECLSPCTLRKDYVRTKRRGPPQAKKRAVPRTQPGTLISDF